MAMEQNLIMKVEKLIPAIISNLVVEIDEYDYDHVYRKMDDVLESVRIIVINLERSNERWQSLKSQFSHHGITKYHRFSAIDSQQLTAGQISLVDPDSWTHIQQHIRNFSSDHSLGSVGCYLSHVGALSQFLRSSATYGLILEDDIDIKRGFLQRLSSLLKSVPPQFGCIGIGEHVPKVFGRSLALKLEKFGSEWMVRMPFLLANAVLYTRDYAKLVVDSAFPSRMQWDWHLAHVAYQNRKSTWMLTKPMIGRNNKFSKKSDIHSVDKTKSQEWKIPKGFKAIQDPPHAFKGSNSTVNYSLVYAMIAIFLVLLVIIIVVMSIAIKLNKSNKSMI